MLQKLKRKYGPALNDVLTFAEKARETLDVTQNFEEHLRGARRTLTRQYMTMN